MVAALPNPMNDRPAASGRELLRVENLQVTIRRAGTDVHVVDDVSFSIQSGQTLGLVGESGSGKSMTGLAIMRLLPRTAAIAGGRIVFDGADLQGLSDREMRRLRGRRISMVLQDSTASLDPSFTVGDQIAEPLVRHNMTGSESIRAKVLDSLRMVRMPSPEIRADNFPHQLSGGMRQRAASAIALACRPDILIADEPTTALDVTIEAQYLRLLKRLQAETGIAVLLISHNLNVVRRMASTIAVMYAGQVVELGPTGMVYEGPRHPYTRALLNCLPGIGSGRRLEAIPGQPPDLSTPPTGCRFADRCSIARDVCRQNMPALTGRGEGRSARCFATEPGGWMDVVQ